MISNTLSPKQLEIWQRLAMGKTAKQITGRRCTCHEHLRRVRVKLGVRTNIQAAIVLTKLGVL